MRSDERTFTAIVKNYQRPLYGYIRRVVISHEDAEDILQETFAKAFRRLWTVRSEEALPAWLFRIATNETRRHLRRKKPLVFTDTLPDTRHDCGEGTDAKVAEGILIPRVMPSLTPLEREVFSLKYYFQMDYAQISRITGSNVNTLMVCWHNAKEKIKKEILK